MTILRIVFSLTLVILVITTGTIISAQAAPLSVNQHAPDFSLKATGGKTVTLNQFKGKYLIVVFYPKDNTPGCTVQLCSLRDTYAQVKKSNAEVIGINAASVASHEKFSKKQQYPFLLLSDPDNHTAKGFGVGSYLGLMNKRTVFVLNPTGVVIFSEEGMPTPETLLAVIHKNQALH